MKLLKHKKALARLVQITSSYWLLKQRQVDYPPYRLWIEPTNRCNIQCTMCPNKDFKKEELGFMDFDLYKNIIDQSSGWVHDVNLHHRGEPLLHPQLPEMVEYAANKGIKVKLHTNATGLTEKISTRLISSGLRLISFSFDGHTANVYEKIRVGADFEKTLNNIYRFLEIKKKHNKSDLRTVLELIDFDKNNIDKQARNQFCAGLKQRGLNKLIIKTPHNWAGNVDLNTFEKESFSACTFPWHALVVLWDGRVGACPHDFFAKIIYGDAGVNTLQEIFNSPVIRSLRAEMLAGSMTAVSSPCRECDSIRRKRVMGIPLASIKYLRD